MDISKENHSKNGVYWFTNDLRLSDNLAFIRAAQNLDSLICVYCLDPQLLETNEFGISSLGPHRAKFLLDNLFELNASLEAYGSSLQIYFSNPVEVFSYLVNEYKINSIYTAKQFAYREIEDFKKVQERNPSIDVFEIGSHTLFSIDDLPFELNEFPATFTKFRKITESLNLRESRVFTKVIPSSLPGMMNFENNFAIQALKQVASLHGLASGGEIAANKQLQNYFSSKSPARYKKTRNSLDGWSNSTKFSFWLAHGCISPIQIMHKLQEYEVTVEKNESTYWIYFELLWREYFQWYALLHGKRLFLHKGIQQHALGDSFNLKSYVNWCEGRTGFEIVDACMRELNATGYMSNRGRQIVASCFVNELNLDWRYGAAYFEHMLIDYDVASNWGNWQYLAGVGADSQGKRHFNLEKQTAAHDPEGKFRDKWL